MLTNKMALQAVRRRLALAAVSAGMAGLVSGSSALAEVPTVSNVTSAFNSVQHQGEWLGFFQGAGAPEPLVVGDHWQGMARHPDPEARVMYVSRAGTPPNIVAVKFDFADAKDNGRLRSNRLMPDENVSSTPPPSSDRIVWNYNFPEGGMDHAGGMQVANTILAVGLDNGLATGGVAFFDVSDPEVPQRLAYALMRPENNGSTSHTVGMVGLTQLDNGDYFLVMTWTNNNNVEFYKTSQQDPAMWSDSNWELVDEWLPSEAVGWDWPTIGGTDYSHQSLNLVKQSDGTIYMIGMYNTFTTAPILSGSDLATLYRVDILINGQVRLEYINERTFDTGPWSTSLNGNFNAGTGIWVDPSGGLFLHCCDHANVGPGDCTRVSEFAPTSPSPDACTTYVRLYELAGFGGHTVQFDGMDRNFEDMRNLSNFDSHPTDLFDQGFDQEARSVRWSLPPGCTCRLWDGFDWSGDYYDLVGAGTIGNLSDVNWRDEETGAATSSSLSADISSLQFIGSGCAAGTVVVRPDGAGIQGAANASTGGPCAMLKAFTGTYPEAVEISKQIEIRAVGGPVVIGAP